MGKQYYFDILVEVVKSGKYYIIDLTGIPEDSINECYVCGKRNPKPQIEIQTNAGEPFPVGSNCWKKVKKSVGIKNE